MPGTFSTEALKQQSYGLKFFCAKCNKPVEKTTTEVDSYLFRVRIVIECHGDIETKGFLKLDLAEPAREIVVFEIR